MRFSVVSPLFASVFSYFRSAYLNNSWIFESASLISIYIFVSILMYIFHDKMTLVKLKIMSKRFIQHNTKLCNMLILHCQSRNTIIWRAFIPFCSFFFLYKALLLLETHRTKNPPVFSNLTYTHNKYDIRKISLLGWRM